MRYNLLNEELAELTPLSSRTFTIDSINNAFYTTQMRESDTMLEKTTIPSAQ